jgi:hypothetical protein
MDRLEPCPSLWRGTWAAASTGYSQIRQHEIQGYIPDQVKGYDPNKKPDTPLVDVSLESQSTERV